MLFVLPKSKVKTQLENNIFDKIRHRDIENKQWRMWKLTKGYVPNLIFSLKCSILSFTQDVTVLLHFRIRSTYSHVFDGRKLRIYT